jgi:hypothetical protein
MTHIAWPVIKPLLSKDVTERVQVLSGDMTAALLEYIDEDNLPLEFQKGQSVKPSDWPKLDVNSHKSANDEKRTVSPNKTEKFGGSSQSVRTSTTRAGSLASEKERQELASVSNMNDGETAPSSPHSSSSYDTGHALHTHSINIAFPKEISMNADPHFTSSSTLSHSNISTGEVITRPPAISGGVHSGESNSASSIYWEIWTAEMFDAYEPKCSKDFFDKEEALTFYKERWLTTRVLVSVFMENGSLCIEESLSDGVNIFALDAIRRAIYEKHTIEPLQTASLLLLNEENNKKGSTDKLMALASSNEGVKVSSAAFASANENGEKLPVNGKKNTYRETKSICVCNNPSSISKSLLVPNYFSCSLSVFSFLKHTHTYICACIYVQRRFNESIEY